MTKIIVLGAGMVGSAMAIDLSNNQNYEVTIADLSLTALENIKKSHPKINTTCVDVTIKEELTKTLAPFDLVICAVPGFLGYQTLECIIKSKKDVVDISFFPENALTLNQLAIDHDVTAIVDCGVAPGMGNIILGHYNESMQITHFECLVGGLPKIKKWPFNYKAPFSPVDVIEEYTRPARYIENGQLITRDALTDVELIDFKSVGTLESFNSDGLRSLIFTMPHIPNMKEKTLRYPGHVDYIKALKSSGFFSSETIDFKSQKISPMEFTSEILFKEWFLKPHEEELTVMKISIIGTNRNNDIEEVCYELFDVYNSTTQTSSMARTTGYTATAAANLILNNQFNEKGVFPPELVGKHPHCFDYVINYLKERDINYLKTSKIQNQ